MNKKNLLILIVAAVVIGGVSISLLKKDKSSWSSGDDIGSKVIADFPLNDVAEILLEDREGKVHLKKNGELWGAVDRNGYPADFNDIHGLLTGIWKMEAVQRPKVGESHLGRLKLQDPAKAESADEAAIKATFKDASGSEIAVVHIGKEHMTKSQGNQGMGGGSWPDGRYVMANGDIKTVSLVKETFQNAEIKVPDWLNKDFFKVQKLKSVDYASNDGTNTWKLARETESSDFTLAGAGPKEEVNTTNANGLKNLFSSPSFVDVSSETDATKTGLDKPSKVTIETFEGFTYDVAIGNEDSDENRYLSMKVSADIQKERTPAEDEKEEDKAKLDKEHADKVKQLEDSLAAQKKFEGHVYLVSGWTVNPVLKPRSDMVQEKKEEAPEVQVPLLPGASLPEKNASEAAPAKTDAEAK